MKKNFLYLATAVFSSIFFSACNVINPKEQTPHFLHIDSVQMAATNTPLHGSVSSKITDVWVYHNNDLLGAFTLPADIPILSADPNLLDIRAGILTNGIQATREGYPFYKLYSTKIDWPEGTRKNITPIFNYVDNAKFFTIEDFELGTSLIRLNGDTTITKYIGPEVYEGTACGASFVDKSKPTTISTFQTGFNLPFNRTYFLEMNYKCNIPINLFVTSEKNGVYVEQFLAGMNPKTSWNKIYFNIGELVNSIRATAPYNIVIKAELPKDSTSGYIFIDNFKLVGFN